MIKMIWKTLAVDKMDIEKTADLKCISRLLVEKWHVDQIKMKITVSPMHSSSLCRGENHEMMTKRIYVFATMRGPCLQPAPATWGTTTARCRVAESNCGVWWWQ